MPPIVNNTFLAPQPPHVHLYSRFSETTAELRQQWLHPTDTMSILLLLGGEVVKKALAQLAGGIITPVAFSFGWASYAVTTLLASVGDVRLMPASEEPGVVVTAKNGYVRNNYSWILDRLLRDYEAWCDPAVAQKVEKMLDQRHAYLKRNAGPGIDVPRPGQTGLCVSVYEPSTTMTAGEPTRGITYWSGLAVVFVQLFVAAIPTFVSQDWGVLLVTLCGTILAFLTGALPQWKLEKWPCRRGSHNTHVLTRGNGAQHAIVILGNGRGLNLEDLAMNGQMNAPSSTKGTRVCLAILSVLWVGVVIAASGLKANTWFLLSIGGMGILQNVTVAGWRGNPSALGIHLNFRRVIGEMATMDTLLALEADFPTVGESLLPVFFPGKLLQHELEQWEALSARTEEERAGLKGEGQTESSPKESWNSHAKTYRKTRTR